MHIIHIAKLQNMSLGTGLLEDAKVWSVTYYIFIYYFFNELSTDILMEYL